MAKARCPELDEAEMTAEQARVYSAIASGPRGAVRGPLRVWLQSPALAERAQVLGQFARYDSALAPHLSELAILVTARIWGSGYEWNAHAPIALEAGVDASVIEKIGCGMRPDFADPEQGAVFAFALELHRDRRVSDATYAWAVEVLGEVRVVELVGICGYYTLISMTINAFEVPDGAGPALPDLDFAAQDMFR